MTLLLRATTLNDEPISLPLLGRFDERGGTVGRSDDATLTLPDPERLISRTQAQIVFRDNGYWIENLSLVSPILHNGRALSNGMRVVLQDGDELRISGYSLDVTFEDDNDNENATLLAGRTVVPRVRRSSGEGNRSASGRGASAEVVEREPPKPARETAPPAQREPAAAREPVRAEPLRAEQGRSERDSAHAPQDSAAGARAAQWPTGQFPTPPTLSAAIPVDGNIDALWQAFLQGADLDTQQLPDGPTPELFRAIGEMLQTSVDGLQRLMTMRAQAKNEMQAEMTMIQRSDNNPLKFSPDAELALKMLLQPKARGFMGGSQALSDAVSDLQAHQVGMTAGMRSVVNAVLDRLDPIKFEAQPAPQRSALDFLKSGQREARLWESYVKAYRALREETQGGLQRLVGEAMRGAYEAQLRNIDTTFGDTTYGDTNPPAEADENDWRAEEAEPRGRPRR